MTFSSRPEKMGGFSLIELLVAIAVLGLLIAMLGQMFSLMSSTWRKGQQVVNNHAKARSMLDLLARDLQSMPIRPDLPGVVVSSSSSPSIEFYTLQQGVPAEGGSVRNISLVSYGLKSGTASTGLPTTTLERADMPIMLGDPASYVSFGNKTGFTPLSGATGTLTPRDTAPGIIAFQPIFVQKDGSTSTTTFSPWWTTAGTPNTNPTCSIGIALAVIDDRTMTQLSAEQLSKLQSLLGPSGPSLSSSGTSDIAAKWESYLNGGGMSWNQFPNSLGVGLAVFERYVALPTNP